MENVGFNDAALLRSAAYGITYVSKLGKCNEEDWDVLNLHLQSDVNSRNGLTLAASPWYDV